MLDSDFWRELAAQFLNLYSGCDPLWAHWQHQLGSPVADDTWTRYGTALLLSQFEPLARRGATRIAHEGISDLLHAWLDALRRESINFEVLVAQPIKEPGGPSWMMGRIVRLCEASANYCKKLESQAVQAEFEAKQRTESTPERESQTAVRLRLLDEKYQVIEFDGRQYELTPYQSTVIRVLHTAHLENRRPVGIEEIHKAIGIHSGKMSDWFRGRNKKLFASLIVRSGSRQLYRLDL
jgi:hypothetical protein